MKYRVFFLLVILTYWVAGFYPFHLTGPFTFQRGEITRSPDNGFVFPKRSIATPGSEVEWLTDAIQQNNLNIEFSAQPKSTEPQLLARILAISKNDYDRNLIIGQKLENLVVYVRTVNEKPDGDVYVVPRVFAGSVTTSVNISLGLGSIQINIDGTERLRATLPEEFMQSWHPDHAFALGNELTYAFPWEGTLSPVDIQVGERTYTYTFDNLVTAGSYQTGLSLLDYKLRNSISFVDWRHHVKADWVVNFLGFIPFGIMLAILRKRGISLVAGTMLCGLLSLSVEFGQFFIENRTPQVIDLLMNILGGGVGVWIGAWVSHLGWNRMPDSL